MYIKEINWKDHLHCEADVLVSNDTFDVLCYSYPCDYILGQIVNVPLECLDVDSITLASNNEDSICKTCDKYEHKLIGMLSDKSKGIVTVGSIVLHIDDKLIAKDIVDGDYIEFVAYRIDI